MRYCSICGELNPDSSAICLNCHAPLKDKTKNKIECPICHELNEANRDTCFKCHVSLDFKVYNAIKNEKESNVKECPNCHAVNNINSYSCYNCGRNFNKVTSVIHDTNEKCYCKHCGISLEYEDVLCKKCHRTKTILRIILYFIAGLIYSIIQTALRFNGILLGALPSIIILIILFYFANFIPKWIMDI